jgi:hypothetical protein
VSEVVEFRPSLVGDGIKIDCDQILTAALGRLENVVIIGTEKDGSPYTASSDGLGETILLIELAKRDLLGSTA